MPTIFTHAVVPLALGLALGRSVVSPRLIAAGMFAAIAPDFDTVAFKLGIDYDDQFGHRGASHSLLFALAVGLCGAVVAPWLRARDGGRCCSSRSAPRRIRCWMRRPTAA